MRPQIFYDNRLADAIPVASSTASGDYNVLNLIAWRGYRFWKPNAIPATVTTDGGSAHSANSVFVYGHNLFTNGDTLEIRGSTDNFSASNVLVHSVTPTSDRPFAARFASASFRYWRATITTGTAPTIAIIVIGTALELDGYLTFDDFDPVARRVLGETHANELGQPMGKIIDAVISEQTVTLRQVSWTWLRNTWMPAWDAHLRAEPCGFSWDSGTDSEPLLVQLGDSLRTPHQANRFASVSFDLTAVRT